METLGLTLDEAKTLLANLQAKLKKVKLPNMLRTIASVRIAGKPAPPRTTTNWFSEHCSVSYDWKALDFTPVTARDNSRKVRAHSPRVYPNVPLQNCFIFKPNGHR